MGTGKHPFAVRIDYSEFMGGTTRTVQTTFNCVAVDAEAAKRLATTYFEDTCRSSNVAWTRRIDKLQVLAETMAPDHPGQA